jgi:hypothetical protein
MLLLRWLLVVIQQFQRQKLERLRQLEKNRRENGSRADLFGSNLHSNGDLFRGLQFFLYTSDVNIITAVVNVNVIAVITFDITYFV